MHPLPPVRRHSPATRGSTLIGVVLFTSVMVLLVASILGWSLTERRLNIRNALLLESRNAAEALAEYGFSQIRQKFETRSTFSLNPGGTDALRLPDASFWSNSNIDAPINELLGGTIQTITTPGSGLYYVDPADPNNEFDPLKGKWVFRRDVAVIARATANGTQGTPITSYVTERISVRGAPLFAHAIFYNMDLEIFPGPAMNIYGPVHANGNIYVSSQGSQLNFRGAVTASGHIYHAWKNDIAGTRGTGNETLGGTPVRFTNKSGELVTMKDGGNVWRDSLMGGSYDYTTPTAANPTPNAAAPTFRAYASQTWNGNVQTSSHGITDYAPVAIGQYEEDPTPTNSLDESNNSGRALIEPSSYPAAGDPDYGTKMEIEAQKYANNAGIYVTVDPANKQIVSITSRSVSDPTNVKMLSATATTSYKGIFTYQPYSTQSTTTNTSGAATPAKPTGGGSEKTTTATQTTTATVTVTSGLYDQRGETGVDLVEIDVGQLKAAVGEMQKAAGSRDEAVAIGDTPNNAAGDGALTPDDWTGIVYVEVQGGPTTNPADGSTNAGSAVAGTVAVRVVNGKTTVPSYGTQNEGLTIATNAPMYVKGSYNADGVTTDGGGDLTQSSANKPDSGEVPAALVADAITLLSEGFDDSTSYKAVVTTTTKVSQSWKKVNGTWVATGSETSTSSSNTAVQNTARPAASGDIEVAAALLMGLTPTYKNGVVASSGGAHNFPRFLENWGGKSTWIRGSLVALFESRVATEPWSTSYYSPPNRNWGFNDLFRQGRFPPGTPRVLSYRRVAFTDLSAADFKKVKDSFTW